MSADAVQTPTLAGFVTNALDGRMRGVRVALPGVVQTYDPTTQTCSVQPLVQDGVYDESGTRIAERLPVVASVPVCFPGSGAFSVTWPVKPGDTVLLVFSSSSIDRWLALGGEVDPIDDRRHHITDAIAIPGLRDLGHVLPSSAVDATSMVISGPLKLGDNTASSPVALNSDLAAIVNILATWMPVSSDGGAALKLAVTNYITAHPGFPVGSTTTKAK